MLGAVVLLMAVCVPVVGVFVQGALQACSYFESPLCDSAAQGGNEPEKPFRVCVIGHADFIRFGFDRTVFEDGDSQCVHDLTFS